METKPNEDEMEGVNDMYNGRASLISVPTNNLKSDDKISVPN